MKIILLIILITIICHCNVSSQSLWQTTAIPFTSVNQQINDISFVTADIGYVNVCNHTSNVFNQITIYKTTDKGFNWISKGNIGINVYSITNPAMEFINVNTGYVGTIKEENNIYYMVIYKTTNGGGPITFTVINNNNLTVPDDYELFQNYPNPFNATSKILYQISKTSDVKISVFDIRGQEIKTLLNERHSTGTYETEFDGSELSSGVYFYSLYADNKIIDTKKMVIIK